MTHTLLAPELERLRQTAAAIAREVAEPAAERTDAEARWPEQAMAALADEGLLGLAVPRRLGGLGQGFRALAVVTEELGRACGSTGLVYGMHCVGAKVLAVKPTPVQEERWLRPIAEGRHVTSLALSEPGTGSHFYLPEATFRRDGDSFVLDGTKSFVTSGSRADSYVMSAVAEGSELDPGTFSCLLLERDTPGMEWQAEWGGFGMRGNSSRTVELNGVRVGSESLLGEQGDETWYVFEVIAPFFIVAMAGTYVGIARRALELAVEDLGSRVYPHSGGVTGSAPVAATRLGELWITVERARQLLRHAAELGDANVPEARAALLACKAEVAAAVETATNDAMTLMGGRAYGANSTMTRLMRDARAAHVMAPTTDLLKTWLGRTLLGQPLL